MLPYCSVSLTQTLVYHLIEKPRQVAVDEATTSMVTRYSFRLRAGGVIRTGTSTHSLRNRRGAIWRRIRKRYLRIFGDREVVCLADRTGVELWFFNPNFAPDPKDWDGLFS
ncbi:hypothetical protein VTN49DRAFT_2396 [Thermomyces lanuginosus]|uniref:uncharacterized protein n=1 Tax=Thermomyces lanuginosus TaxID=5541 RepID=UPI003744A815